MLFIFPGPQTSGMLSCFRTLRSRSLQFEKFLTYLFKSLQIRQILFRSRFQWIFITFWLCGLFEFIGDLESKFQGLSCV